MGPVLPVSLLWGLEVISVRVQHRAWCTDLTPQELREAMYMCTNDGTEKDGPSWDMREVNRALGTHQVEMSPGWFHGRVCLGWAWKDGQDADRLWEEGRFHKKEKLWRKQDSWCLTLESSPPLPGPHIRPTFTISEICSLVLLLQVSTIAEGPLMCFWTDGVKLASPSPSLPLVCMSAVQWELRKLIGTSLLKDSVC